MLLSTLTSLIFFVTLLSFVRTMSSNCLNRSFSVFATNYYVLFQTTSFTEHNILHATFIFFIRISFILHSLCSHASSDIPSTHSHTSVSILKQHYVLQFLPSQIRTDCTLIHLWHRAFAFPFLIFYTYYPMQTYVHFR